jgi:hypothetical protein
MRNQGGAHQAERINLPKQEGEEKTRSRGPKTRAKEGIRVVRTANAGDVRHLLKVSAMPGFGDARSMTKFPKFPSFAWAWSLEGLLRFRTVGGGKASLERSFQPGIFSFFN